MAKCSHCGSESPSNRSLPDHRRLFGIIGKVYDQWPESHEFRPESVDHLRAYLTCRAGPEYRNATPIQLPADAGEMMQSLFRAGIESAIRAAHGMAFVVPYHSGVAVISPKSMSFARMGKAEFSRLRNAIEDVIVAETGISIDALSTQKEAA